MGDRIDRVVLASVEGTDQTLKLPAYTAAFLERVGALLQNDPKAVSLPPLPDPTRHDLAVLVQESVEAPFVPDGGEESVTMTPCADPDRLSTASGLHQKPEKDATSVRYGNTHSLRAIIRGP